LLATDHHVQGVTRGYAGIQTTELVSQDGEHQSNGIEMPVFYEDYPEAWSKDNNEYKIRKAERSSNSCSVEWR